MHYLSKANPTPATAAIAIPTRLPYIAFALPVNAGAEGRVDVTLPVALAVPSTCVEVAFVRGAEKLNTGLALVLADAYGALVTDWADTELFDNGTVVVKVIVVVVVLVHGTVVVASAPSAGYNSASKCFSSSVSWFQNSGGLELEKVVGLAWMAETMLEGTIWASLERIEGFCAAMSWGMSRSR